MQSWSLDHIPELNGRHAIVTGANVGLGYRSALELARHGAAVTLACRRRASGEEAIERIRLAVPAARVAWQPLDLADLDSVAAFCATFRRQQTRLDILLNNAGVVNLAELQRTDAGHEMHMATNHYGHFALTMGLFDLIAQTPQARVVTVTSGGYR